ncbi:amidase [Rhizodiscina lignyota]|uniref:Amidase n=1 Tax=Rhizodiscina lignyota TaxID=1504668 RepID=A0A9P4MDI4_9PEZI|nr:amidase [Rhizodiscina lignyota]
MSTSQSVGFDAREATIDTVQHAIFSGLASVHDVVSAFIARIEKFDSKINAVISLNPNALSDAAEQDRMLAAGNATGPLFGVPICLKDNYDTASIPTTGGNLALKNSQPTEDAPAVAVLRKAGAIILGKCNLHELALEGISVSSVGGQTINPYDSTRTPGGSSGGTGAGVAASFFVFGTGTDTVNSLRSPPASNSLFSIRPTRGLISRQGIIPISTTQDVIGPIARTIKDVAVALTVMSSIGYDPQDNDTARVPQGNRNIDYAAAMDTAPPLKGLRLGLIEGFFNRTASTETTPVNEAFDKMVSRLTAAGATVVSIKESIYNSTAIQAFDTQRFEYRENMNKYLQRPSLKGTHPSTLDELYETSSNGTGGKFLVIPSQYEYVTTSLKSSTSNATYDNIQRGISNLTIALQSTFAANNLDALIYPEQQHLVVKLGSPSQSGRNGILAALTGAPVVVVPAGFSPPTETAPIGVPIGMEILGPKWDEAKILGIAWQVEKLTKVRKSPVWAREVVEVSGRTANSTLVAKITPNTKNIPPEYPVGSLGGAIVNAEGVSFLKK